MFVFVLFATALLAGAPVSVSPTPAGSASPVATKSPAPCPSAAPQIVNGKPGARATPPPCLSEIGRTSVGRKANLVGTALSASTGTIGAEQIATRPLLRPGEILEDIPGLVISQHSGGGKANQYYLRGFQLDHGTNLAADIDGVPVNLGSHAHGQGYSDVNYLIPEVVSYVEFKKGPYFADQGDFSVAGGYTLHFRDTIDPIASFSAGDFGYDRLLIADSPRVGDGHLLYAVELGHDDGSYKKPDLYAKFNGLLRYSTSDGPNAFSLTGIAYDGSFNSTDQIPQRLVSDGALNRYGSIDPTDGGNTYRYVLSSAFTHTAPNGVFKVSAYGVGSFLDLYSNFTYDYYDANDYYNVTQNPITCNPAYVSCTPNSGAAPRSNNYQSYCPANNTAPAGAAARSIALTPYTFTCGDQREQLDKRVYYGFDTSRTFVTPRSTTTIGADVRIDNVAENGLFLTNDRIRYPNGTLSNDQISILAPSVYAETTFLIGSKLRATPGLRFDEIDQRVEAYIPANSGSAVEGVLDPKLALAYAASHNQEFYLDYGESFHSNDARGVIGADDPQTHAPFDPSGTPVGVNSPLTRASGEEIGYRYSTPTLTSTVSAFRLLVSNELIFDGDHGTTSVGGPDVRKGIELANFYTPTRYLTYDADLATTTAHFLTDPLHQGTDVPESLAAVISAGATVDREHYAASLRLRYFGPRVLDTQGDANSPPSLIFNTQLTAKFAHRRRLSLDVFNLLNAQVADVTYYYASWLPSDAANPALAGNPAINPALGGAGVNDDHFHPSQGRTVRLTYSTGI